VDSRIKEKLEKIEELYPSDRTNRSIERFERVWKGEKPVDRYPFTYGQMSFGYYDDVHTPEQRVNITLDEMIFHGTLNDDYVPSFFPGCKQSTIPSMFGAKEIIVGRDHSCEKVIFSKEDVYSLPEPSMGPGTVAYEWLEMQKYMVEATDGRIPIHVADMQGPFEVAGQLWGYDNLFMCAYDEPEIYHHLLSKTTEAFLMFWEEQKRIVGKGFVPTHLFGWSWVPQNMGASISADSIVMISPDFFDEFYTPYIEKIGKRLGDLSVHSCGDFSNVFDNLTKIPCVKAINAGQMTVEQLVKAGLDDSTVAIVLSDVRNTKEMFDIIKKYSLRIDLSVISIWPTVDNRFLLAEEMNQQHWDEIRRFDAMISEYAAKCV